MRSRARQRGTRSGGHSQIAVGIDDTDAAAGVHVLYDDVFEKRVLPMPVLPITSMWFRRSSCREREFFFSGMREDGAEHRPIRIETNIP